MEQETSVELLIKEIKRRVSIIQSEPQNDLRELMISILDIDLEKYNEFHKEECIDFYVKGCEDSYGVDEGDDDKKDAENFYNKTFRLLNN